MCATAHEDHPVGQDVKVRNSDIHAPDALQA